MKKVSLLFGIHMHQPVDNFDATVDRAVKESYAPFFDVMVRYPAFKFSLHCSGWLLEKIRTDYPELFETMQYLTRQGSIEWLSGGYYEPVLCSIPPKDIIGQIKKLSRYIQKHFSYRPRGIWLTERVWEPALVNVLRTCDIDYTIVDDYHFLSNGYGKEALDGCWITENDGETLSLFPIEKRLRYTIPFGEVAEAIDAILGSAAQADRAAVLFDDAEKFGLWPGTHKWVYTEKWLETFVRTVVQHERIVPEHYSSYKKRMAPRGIAYLDNASYEEMGEWSLPVQQARMLRQIKASNEEYVCKGGIWKNFFVKYSESNYLHKRMLYNSRHNDKLGRKGRDLLYRLQTNDVFWHGAFGGFYLPSLRDNAYRYLLAIEASRQKEKRLLEWEMKEKQDALAVRFVQSKALSMGICAEHGAQLVEFGSFSARFNWQNTLMRREEPYHHVVAHEETERISGETEEKVKTIHERHSILSEPLKALLVYDWHRKFSFIDHFATEAFSLKTFRNVTFEERGDFADQPFVFKHQRYLREGGIYIDGQHYISRLKRRYRFHENGLLLTEKFTTGYEQTLFFGQELNFHFAHPDEVTINGQKVEEGWCDMCCDEIVIADDFTQKSLVIHTGEPCSVYAYILYTVSRSESGFEKIAQQISLLLTTEFTGTLKWKIALEVSHV